MKTTTALYALPVLLFASLVSAQPAADGQAADPRDPAALEILRKVDAKIKTVHAVSYSGTTRPEGAATAFAGAAEGDIVAEGWLGGVPARFRTHVKAAMPGSEESVELTGGGNGDIYYLIDHNAKKAWADMDPAVMGRTGRAVQGFGMIEFLHDRPFDDELNAEAVELLEEQEVAGEPCYRIRVVYAGGQGESTWLFSKNDLLPRRRVQKFSTPQGEGALEITITDLQVNPTLEAKLFEFSLPEGYEQIDDFAP